MGNVFIANSSGGSSSSAPIITTWTGSYGRSYNFTYDNFIVFIGYNRHYNVTNVSTQPHMVSDIRFILTKELIDSQSRDSYGNWDDECSLSGVTNSGFYINCNSSGNSSYTNYVYFIIEIGS